MNAPDANSFGVPRDAAGHACKRIDRRRWLAALAALPSMATRASPASVAAASAEADEGALRLPPLAVTERRLANGLRVVGLPMPGLATVSIQVWYRVGSRDDPPGRSGFAHLFEHMMFKRTERLPDEAFDRLTEDIGGSGNAYTYADVTVYLSEVPSNHLERLLWAEAERMHKLRVDAAAFVREREVVKEELRETVQADPYGRLFDALPGLVYQRHPYRRPVIGRIKDLDAATLADVQRFHASWYRPDNALLVVAGGFDPAALSAMVDRHFGPLRAPATALPRLIVQEPRRTQPRRVLLHAPVVPLPALVLAWQAPAAASADAAALQVAAALLAQGDSSRLAQGMVRGEPIAQSADFWAELNLDAGMLVAYAIAAAGSSLDSVERTLRGVIRRLATRPIPDAELAKVRLQMLTAALVARQTPAGLADAVGWATQIHGDPRAADAELARLQAVNATDVQRALRRHVVDRPALSVHYRAARTGRAGQALRTGAR